MADEAQPQSIADRIAALKLNQIRGGPPPSYDQAVNTPVNSTTTTTTTTTTTRRPPPPPPPRPALPARPDLNARAKSSNIPTLQDHGTVANNGVSNLPEAPQPNGIANGMDGISRPALPPRTSTPSSQRPALPSRGSSISPALPPRRPSETPSFGGGRRVSDMVLSRKASNESISSVATARSAASGISTATSQSERYAIRAPAFDAASLPALPPRRTQEEKDADHKRHNPASSSSTRLRLKNSTPNILQKKFGTTPPPAARPAVRQPSSSLPRPEAIQEEALSVVKPDMPSRPRPQLSQPPPRKSPLDMGFDVGSLKKISLPEVRSSSVPPAQTDGALPPIPSASRPDLAALQSSKPKLNGNSNSNRNAISSTSQELCLLCRDYSGPDNHAARFPRQSIPSQDLGWLANQLTNPFPSHTDKARALFTWLHHNVEYDTVAFFNNNVKPSTPQSTLSTGLAVCEGYAGLFAALAMKAGLEAYVVVGHGKGYGYSKLQPGESIPPYNAGHAWNAVRIDGGQWKLIDCCWGAGCVSGKGQPYQKRFSPNRFTQSNEEFGLDHFPGENDKQFRSDSRIVTWEEYMIGSKNGCAADFCDGFVSEEGLSGPSFSPVSNPIVLARQPGPTVRFSFQKCCPHWDNVRCGKGEYYMYLLHLDALDGQGRKNDIPFDTDGDVWWVDIPKEDLGRPGQTVRVYALTEFNGESARGYKRQGWANRVGSWQYAGVATWQIA